MDYIEWNYIKAKRQAEKLTEQADRLDRLADCQLDETLHELSFLRSHIKGQANHTERLAQTVGFMCCCSLVVTHSSVSYNVHIVSCG